MVCWISLVENRQRIRQAARNVKQFFADADRVLERSERRCVLMGPLRVAIGGLGTVGAAVADILISRKD